MLDQFAHQFGRQAAAEGQRVPVAFVHVVTGLDVLVAVAQFQGALGIAFQVHAVRQFIGDGEGEHLATDLVHDRLRPERRGFLDSRQREAMRTKVGEDHAALKA